MKENNLQIKQRQPTSLALIGLSRPSLAILNEDYPKVRTIQSKQEINGLLNYLTLILNIKVSNEQERAQLDKQMILVFDLIKTKFGSLTVPEIKEAFKMYVAKEFPDLKVFRILDCMVVSDVLNAFKDYRSDILRVYDYKKQNLSQQQSTMTEEEKNQNHQELLKIIFDDLKATGFSSDAWLLYDNLESNGSINKTKQEKKEIYAAQAKVHLVELQQEAKKMYFHSAKTIIADVKSKIDKGKIIGSVANKCKSLVASEYLNNYLNDFEEFKKVNAVTP